MTDTSRRALLGALGALTVSAAVAPAAATASPARVTPHTPTTPATPATSPVPAVATTTGPRSSMTFTGTPYDTAAFARASLGELSTTVLPGTPVRTEVLHGQQRVAVLTKGARTVLVSGPERTFTENKQPFTDAFVRLVPDPALEPGRRLKPGWGNSPAGGTWSVYGGTPGDADFAVRKGAATMLLKDTEAGRYATLTDDGISDADVTCEAAFDKVPTGNACSFALLFGYRGGGTHYRARLSFTTKGEVDLRVEKVTDGRTAVLAEAGPLAAGVRAGDAWRVRVRRKGAKAQVTAWPAAGVEPARPTAEIEDSDAGLRSGRVGVRGFASPGCANLPVTLTVSRFEVASATWETPPSVTHRDWVRLLDAPFDGEWTPAVEATVRGWAGSMAPDVFSYAAMFLPGAPRVRGGDARVAGADVLGEAGYGKPDSQGLLPVGADFHDYMERPWTFPDATKRPEEGQRGHLDCSGYVRMVYGFHMGVGMVAGKDPAKKALPRKSGAMVDFAPGVRVAQRAEGGGSAPDLGQLQPGDLLLFDVNDREGDPVDPDAYAVDHVAVYLGPDQAGQRRFLSSRKSADGPTMADVSGASTLESPGIYADSLHTVHRV
ncbi:C40 family peptidase [Streptomyces sp. HU2014]|uniref:C40 family peptidase n=1 Tax=Streptomyces sp. HU2014 TaxID=2939414 RepID=UPI00200FE723|nr:C40 family peptidase [Streptomyces sp. HU2014]UQI46000.1 C40 family peptidase [Streptomyces sp. HU2014]